MTVFRYKPGFGYARIGTIDYEDEWGLHPRPASQGYFGGDVIRFGAGIDPASVRTSIVVERVYNAHGVFVEERRDLLIGTGSGTIEILAFHLGMNVRLRYADGTVERIGGATISELDGGDVDTLLGTVADDVFASRASSDVLQGEDGSDTYRFTGAFGDDTISDVRLRYDDRTEAWVTAPSVGFNRLEFGPGIARSDLSFARDGDALVIRAPGGSVTLPDWFDFYRLPNNMTLRFADGSGFSLYGTPSMWRTAIDGTAGDDTLRGGVLSDMIRGLDGDDVIVAFGGSDTVSGGNGDDTVSVGRPVKDEGHALYGNAGADSLTGSFRSDTIDGGDGDDTISSGGGTSAYRDTLLGGPGDDVISGGGFLSGGLGDDSLAGGGTLRGDAGNDTIRGVNSLSGGDGDDVVMGSGVLAGDAGADTLIGNAGIKVLLAGGAGDDLLRAGGRAAATLWGGDGNDLIFGAEEGDAIAGGTGDDRIHGGGGTDSISGGAGDDTISTVAADAASLSGGVGDDMLVGGAGRDTLRGDAGADLMIGLDGNDLYDGGGGADVVRIAGKFGHDTVAGFEDGLDRIDVRAFRALPGGAAMTLDDLRIVQDGANAVITLDLDGDGRTDLIDFDRDGTYDAVSLTLTGVRVAALGTADFIL